MCGLGVGCAGALMCGLGMGMRWAALNSDVWSRNWYVLGHSGSLCEV